jgi:hypothetical protein
MNEIFSYPACHIMSFGESNADVYMYKNGSALLVPHANAANAVSFTKEDVVDLIVFLTDGLAGDHVEPEPPEPDDDPWEAETERRMSTGDVVLLGQQLMGQLETTVAEPIAFADEVAPF